MKFQDTWGYLQKGMCVIRAKTTKLVFLLPRVDELWCIDYELKDDVPHAYVPTIQDLLGEDWETLQ